MKFFKPTKSIIISLILFLLTSLLFFQYGGWKVSEGVALNYIYEYYKSGLPDGLILEDRLIECHIFNRPLDGRLGNNGLWAARCSYKIDGISAYQAEVAVDAYGYDPSFLWYDAESWDYESGVAP